MPFKVTNNATTILASGVSSSDTTFTVATGTGSLFPIINAINDVGYFYVRVGTDEDNEVKKCTARSSDSFTCDSFSSNWPSGTTVKLTVCSQLFDEIPRIITTDTTYTLKSSGGDFNNFGYFWLAIKDVIIVPPAIVTLNIDPGEWSVYGTDVANTLLDSSLYLNSERIRIFGTIIFVDITSVQSSSGSSGAWSIELNVTSVGTAAVNEYLVVMDTPTGGTNPEYLLGCHPITNVDSGNNRITISSVNQTATAPSGAVTTTASVHQTRIVCPNPP